MSILDKPILPNRKPIKLWALQNGYKVNPLYNHTLGDHFFFLVTLTNELWFKCVLVTFPYKIVIISQKKILQNSPFMLE